VSLYERAKPNVMPHGIFLSGAAWDLSNYNELIPDMPCPRGIAKLVYKLQIYKQQAFCPSSLDLADSIKFTYIISIFRLTLPKLS
jgi:hypothetical protein